MAKYLTDRQNQKLEEIARWYDGLTAQQRRQPAPAFLTTGTDFGTPIVPATTITAASRTVQVGSDDFDPGTGTAWLFRKSSTGKLEPRLDDSGSIIVKTVYNLSNRTFEPNASGAPDYIGPGTPILFALMDWSGLLYIPSGESSRGLPVGAFILGYLAPIIDGATKYYIDRDGLADTDWALADGISNVSPGSGIAMWDRGGGDSDPFFVRAKDALAICNNTAAGRTVPPGDPDVDEVQLHDHLDHTHNILDLCEKQYVKGFGADPKLCAWDLVGGNCATECVSTVRDEADCTSAAPTGVLEHTTTNGQASVVEYFEVTPPNKKLHFFERVA